MDARKRVQARGEASLDDGLGTAADLSGPQQGRPVAAVGDHHVLARIDLDDERFEDPPADLPRNEAVELVSTGG